MNVLRPSVAEERWLALRDALGDAVVPLPLTDGWRRASLLPRIAFFFLGALCSAAVFGLTHALFDDSSGSGVVAAVVCIAAAELLIIGKRSWGFGFEEALYLGAGTALVAAMPLRELRSYAALSAIVIAVAAARLANPLFATFAAGLSILAVWLAREQLAPTLSLCTAAVAVAVWLVITKHFARPSLHGTLRWLAVALPLYTYLLSLYGEADRWPALLAGIFVAGALAFRYRERALLYASFACAVMLAFELRKVTPLSVEVTLIVYGAATLIGAVVAERSLRRPRGVTSLPLGRDGEAWRLVELGAAAAAATAGPADPPAHQAAEQRTGPESAGDGSSFGGGGAGGGF